MNECKCTVDNLIWNILSRTTNYNYGIKLSRYMSFEIIASVFSFTHMSFFRKLISSKRRWRILCHENMFVAVWRIKFSRRKDKQCWRWYLCHTKETLCEYMQCWNSRWCDILVLEKNICNLNTYLITKQT